MKLPTKIGYYKCKLNGIAGEVECWFNGKYFEIVDQFGCYKTELVYEWTEVF